MVAEEAHGARPVLHCRLQGSMLRGTAPLWELREAAVCRATDEPQGMVLSGLR